MKRNVSCRRQLNNRSFLDRTKLVWLIFLSNINSKATTRLEPLRCCLRQLRARRMFSVMMTAMKKLPCGNIAVLWGTKINRADFLFSY